MYVQDTHAEDGCNTESLLPGHLQSPDGVLRQTEHSKVGPQLDACRDDLQIEQVEAFALHSEVPDTLMRSALQIQRNGNGDSRSDLYKRDHTDAPEKGAFCLVSRDKEPNPLNHNRNFQER